MKRAFYNCSGKVNFNSFHLPAEKYNSLIEEVKFAKTTDKKVNRHYWLLRRYDVYSANGREQLVCPPSKNKPALFYAKFEDVFDILYEIHVSEDHIGRDKMRKIVQLHYRNITFQNINSFLKFCESCAIKHQKNPRNIEERNIEEKNVEESNLQDEDLSNLFC